MESSREQNSGGSERPRLVAQSRQGVEAAKKAKVLLQRGDWPSARSLYRKLVTAFPGDKDLRRHVLLSAFKWSDYQEVLTQGLQLADLYLAEGDSQAALDRYSEVLRLPELVAGEHGARAGREVEELVEPLKADIYFVYGDHYLGLEQGDLALQYFDVSDRLQQGRWETDWGRGQAWLLKGDFERAERHLQQSIRRAPDEAASSYELLAEVLLEQRREPAEVRPLFLHAIRVFESFECYEDALRVVFRWLQLDTQDREMADRAKELTKLLYS